MPGTLLTKKNNNKSCEKFLNSILYIYEANYQTAQTPRGLPLNYRSFIITCSVPGWPYFHIFYRAGWGMINIIIIITIGPTFNIFQIFLAKVITNTTLGLE